MNEADLAARAKRGDSNAFAELVMAQKDRHFRIAFSYAKQREAALDIVGEAVYKAYISVHKLKQTDYFYTWFTRILINCALSYSKKSQRLVLTADELVAEHSPTANREEILDLHQAIDRLDEKERTVVMLKYLNDLTIEEVAEVLQSPVGTIKTVLHRALKELRLELKEESL